MIINPFLLLPHSLVDRDCGGFTGESKHTFQGTENPHITLVVSENKR